MADAVKIFINEISSDLNLPYAATKLPNPDNNDITLFFRKSTEEGELPDMKYHVAGTNPNYTLKRRSNTIMETGIDLEEAHVQSIIDNIARVRVLNALPGNDIGPAVVKLMEALIELNTADDADLTGLEALKTTFTTGGNYLGREANADGTLGPERNLVYALREAGDVFESVTRQGILALLNTIIPAVKYEGFSPRIIRNTFITKDPSDIVITKRLILAFTAYSHIGNNVSKLAVRRVDVPISKRVMNAVESMGVQKVNRTKNGLTLPRLAIAFMPEYFIFRKYLAGELQSQTESKIDVEYKDIVFYGSNRIRSMNGYEDFHKEFSSYIFKKGEPVAMDDAAFMKSYKQWNKVSMAGFTADADVRERLDSALDLNAADRAAAFDYILQGITAYRAAGL
jgi:hypothetical protein